MSETKKIFFKVTIPRGIKSTSTSSEIRSAVRAVKKQRASRTLAPKETALAGC